MKKTIQSLLFIGALIISLVPATHAFAQVGNRSENGRAESRSSESKNELEDEKEEENEQEDKDDAKNITGDEHKSVVAKFVAGLEKAADSDKKVGEQVREIAKAQHETDEEVADAIDKVKNRGKFVTFLVGTDYKNIGKIRSETAKTEQQITKLQTLVDEATTPEAKETLTEQIKTIQAEQKKLDDFVKANEQTFSLFGWFVKLFASN